MNPKDYAHRAIEQAFSADGINEKTGKAAKHIADWYEWRVKEGDYNVGMYSLIDCAKALVKTMDGYQDSQVAVYKKIVSRLKRNLL